LEYDVSGLRELTSMILNALVYQRFIKEDEFYKRYDITAPTVSRDHWDYSKDILKKFGKDEETKKQKEIEQFEEQFESLDLIFKILKLKQLGDSYIFAGASLQLKHIEKNRNMPQQIFESNSLYYMECILKYFKNVFIQLIDGSVIGIKDNESNYINTIIFEPDLFSEVCSQLGNAINKLDKLKSDSTTQNISKTELQKIFEGQITKMDDLKTIIRDIGTSFYNAGSILKNLYETKTIPFHDCIIKSLPLKNNLSDRMLDKAFVGSGYSDGVFGSMMIYCYQAAQLCSNDYLKKDLYDRETLITLIKQLKTSQNI
jgi:hypothetical protein